MRAGKGHVSLAFIAADILNNHIDIDIGIGQWRKNIGHRTGTVRDARERYFRFILVMGDAGDQLAFHLAILQFCVGHDHRAGDTIGVGGTVVDE